MNINKIYVCVPSYTYTIDNYMPTLYKKSGIHPGMIFSRGKFLKGENNIFLAENPNLGTTNFIIISEVLSALRGIETIDEKNYDYGLSQKLISGDIFTISKNCMDESDNRISGFFKIIGDTFFKSEWGNIPAIRAQCK